MEHIGWLPNYVFKKYGYEITFDQPNLSTDIYIENFVTRMIIPDLQAYILIETDDTKAIIKDNIRKLFIAMDRQNAICPICFGDTNKSDNIVCEACLNIICLDCFVKIGLHNKGQHICPLCRFTKGNKHPHYHTTITGSLPFYTQQ